jgi:hypothetical protein
MMQKYHQNGVTSINSRRKTRYCWSGPKCCKNLMILIATIGLSTLLLTSAVKATFDNNKAQVINVTVLHGDTLWSIAKRVAPDTDPRLVIAKIKQQNHLNTSALTAGQELEFELDH